MNKLTAIFTVLTLTLSLAACGDIQTQEGPSTAAATREETSAATEATTQAPQLSEFQEIVIADNEDMTFRITKIDTDSLWGYTLKAFIENKTNAEITLSLGEASVNGFMCDPFWAETIAAGKRN